MFVERLDCGVKFNQFYEKQNHIILSLQIDLASHNPLQSNGKMISFNDSTVAWVPTSQTQVYRQLHLHDTRISPIVCTRESVSTITFESIT